MDKAKLLILRDEIDRSGIKLGYLAKAMGISNNTLTRKLDGRSEITIPEAHTICSVCAFPRDLSFYIFLS